MTGCNGAYRNPFRVGRAFASLDIPTHGILIKWPHIGKELFMYKWLVWDHQVNELAATVDSMIEYLMTRDSKSQLSREGIWFYDKDEAALFKLKFKGWDGGVGVNGSFKLPLLRVNPNRKTVAVLLEQTAFKAEK